MEEIKAISREYDDGVKESVRTKEREETSCSQREMGAGIEEGKIFKNEMETNSDDGEIYSDHQSHSTRFIRITRVTKLHYLKTIYCRITAFAFA